MKSDQKSGNLFQPEIMKQAAIDAFIKLDPRVQIRNPVMFVVEVGSILTTIIYFVSLGGEKEANSSFVLSISLWLWFTLLSANFSEAMAEGRGKAQAKSLRETRKDLKANKIESIDPKAKVTSVSASSLRIGDLVIVQAQEIIPCDGDVIEGIASVDESAITGESAPVIRESGGDRSSVTGGTRVLSDWLIIKITVNPGETFIEQMIALVEGAKRQKTPNEIALNILLAAFTLIFLVVTTTLYAFSKYSVDINAQGQVISITVLVALLVCLIPTTIGGLLSAIGIAGMDRLIRSNVIAMSGRAVEAAGDVDMLLLDKTGTITLGARQASAFIPATGTSEQELADAAQLASLADETPEGRSIVVLAKEKHGIRDRNIHELEATFVAFSAHTRMSGVNLSGTEIRKGSVDAIEEYVKPEKIPPEIIEAANTVAKEGATPLLVARNQQVLGVIKLKDIVKGGIKERFADLRAMGIKTVMITGDNPITAAAIAAEAGVDDYLAQATPEGKLKLIKENQAGGRLVAMTGDGTNDAPALAQADVAVVMNSGTQAAKEAGNMIDLDSSPTKLIEIVQIGKQLLMTRGALTTFSIANDVAKYFAIIPAAFATTYPVLNKLNVMNLSSPQSAIMSAVIFNALVILGLLPIALRGVKYRPVGAELLLRDNILIYGLGGLIVPFIGIKLIDILISGFKI